MTPGRSIGLDRSGPTTGHRSPPVGGDRSETDRSQLLRRSSEIRPWLCSSGRARYPAFGRKDGLCSICGTVADARAREAAR